MAKESKALTKQPPKGIFTTIASWPYHLLDGITATHIRSNAASVQYTAARLSTGQLMDSFNMTTIIDYTRGIIDWIELYEQADVKLTDMAKVKKELQQLLQSFQQIHTELVFREEEERFKPYSEDYDDEYGEP